MTIPESSRISNAATDLAFGALEIFAPRAHKVATLLGPRALTFFSRYLSHSVSLLDKNVEIPAVEAVPLASQSINIQINFYLKEPIRPNIQEFNFSSPTSNQPTRPDVDLKGQKETSDQLAGRIDVGTLPVRAASTRELIKEYLTHLGALLEQLDVVYNLDSEFKELIDSIQTSSFSTSSDSQTQSDFQTQIGQKCYMWNTMIQQMKKNIDEIGDSDNGLYAKVYDLKPGLKEHTLGKEIVDFINPIETDIFRSARAYLANYNREGAPMITSARIYLSILESIRKFQCTASIQNLEEAVTCMKAWTDTMTTIGSQPIPLWVSSIDYNLSKEWNCLAENSTQYISQQNGDIAEVQNEITNSIEFLQKKTDVRGAEALLVKARTLLAEHGVLIDTISSLQTSNNFTKTNEYFSRISSSTSSKELASEVTTLRENAKNLERAVDKLQDTITRVKEKNAQLQKKVDAVWLGVKTFTITSIGLAIVGRFFGHKCFKY